MDIMISENIAFNIGACGNCLRHLSIDFISAGYTVIENTSRLQRVEIIDLINCQ